MASKSTPPLYRIKPLTADRWADLERLFGPNGANSGCWCMWWRLKRSEFTPRAGAGNKRAFKKIVAAGPSPGLLAYRDGEPVGWCQLTPRADLPSLNRSRLLAAVDDRPVWCISCFFVKAGFRRQGVTAALIAAAKDAAGRRGADLLEAYPWDTTDKTSSGTMFTGRASTFARLGFSTVARRAPHRPIMRCPI